MDVPGAGLAGRPEDHLADIHVRRAGDGVDDRVRDVLGGQGGHALVDPCRGLGVPQADLRELGRDHPRIDGRETNPAAGRVEAQRLVDITHPFGSIVFLNHTTGAIDKVVPGIPWSLGNPISREMVVTQNGNIYLYRGTEHPDYRHLTFNVYQYNIASDTLTMLDFQCTGGFWSGQTLTRDQKHVYIVTVQGELYHLDTTTETWEHWGKILPQELVNQGAAIRNIYGMTLDYKEENIYGIIVRGENGAQSGDLIEYNLATKSSTIVASFGTGIYTGNDTRDSKGNIYFNRFGNSNLWREYCGLLKIHIKNDP